MTRSQFDVLTVPEILDKALARGLPEEPLDDLLQVSRRMFGLRREATLLFADLRRFADLSAPLAHEEVYELLGHVMDCLTTEVLAQDGQVIDYFGDGLAAMWNAPEDQADHATRACQTALAMIELLPDVAADWKGLLQRGELRLGIGIHTGIVQVGNSGSRRLKKYGPRGATVHVASRVEAVTKIIGLPLVLSGATTSRLPESIRTYRICCAELPGVDHPLDLFGALPAQTEAAQNAAVEAYQRGLALFEQGDLESAKLALATIAESRILPTRFLLQQVEQQLGQKYRRRSGDKPVSRSAGVIRIDVK